MKLGTFMMPLHPPEKSRTECFQEDVEYVLLAEALGFTEAWIGQHHTLAWEPIPSNDLFIAHILPLTSKIRLGTGVSIIPQHHPANIAIRLSMLDHLSKGRLNCGFGQGGVPTDWELFDLPDPQTQGLMTLEGIDMILKLWQAEVPFDFQGKFWRIRIQSPRQELGIGTILQPYQKPHPPIGMSIVRGDSRAAFMAGQRGYLPLSTNLIPDTTAAQHWQHYCRGAEDAGQPPPSRALWRVSRSVYVGESEDEAWDHLMNGNVARSFEYLLGLLKSAKMLHLAKHDPEVPDEEVTPEYAVKHLCIKGNVKDCIRQLEEVWEVTGGFGTLLMTSKDWDDQAKWRRSMKLLAEEVVPAMPTI